MLPESERKILDTVLLAHSQKAILPSDVRKAINDAQADMVPEAVLNSARRAAYDAARAFDKAEELAAGLPQPVKDMLGEIVWSRQ